MRKTNHISNTFHFLYHAKKNRNFNCLRHQVNTFVFFFSYRQHLLNIPYLTTERKITCYMDIKLKKEVSDGKITITSIINVVLAIPFFFSIHVSSFHAITSLEETRSPLLFMCVFRHMRTSFHSIFVKGGGWIGVTLGKF